MEIMQRRPSVLRRNLEGHLAAMSSTRIPDAIRIDIGKASSPNLTRSLIASSYSNGPRLNSCRPAYDVSFSAGPAGVADFARDSASTRRRSAPTFSQLLRRPVPRAAAIRAAIGCRRRRSCARGRRAGTGFVAARLHHRDRRVGAVVHLDIDNVGARIRAGNLLGNRWSPGSQPAFGTFEVPRVDAEVVRVRLSIVMSTTAAQGNDSAARQHEGFS